MMPEGVTVPCFPVPHLLHSEVLQLNMSQSKAELGMTWSPGLWWLQSDSGSSPVRLFKKWWHVIGVPGRGTGLQSHRHQEMDHCKSSPWDLRRGCALTQPSAISCAGVYACVQVFETGFETGFHQFGSACWPVSLKDLLLPLKLLGLCQCWDPNTGPQHLHGRVCKLSTTFTKILREIVSL